MALALRIHLVSEWGGLLLPYADTTHYTIAAHNLAFGKCSAYSSEKVLHHRLMQRFECAPKVDETA
jgi:hypothetical protein